MARGIQNKALSALLGLARRKMLPLGLGLAALVCVDLLQLIVPRVIKLAVDDLTQGRADAESLLGQAGLILAFALGMALLRIVWRPLIMGFARRAELLLRQKLFAHLQTLHLDYFRQNPPGEIMARATNDLNNIRMAAGMGLVAAMDGITMGLLSLGFMLYISPELTALALIPMPVVAVGARFMSKRLHKYFLLAQEAFSAMTEIVREALNGIRLVKVYNLAGREEARLEKAARHNYRVNMGLARTLGIFFPLNVLCTNLSLAVVLGFGGRLVILNSISAGDFVAFAAYMNLLTWPMMALGWVVSLMQRAWGSLQRVDEVLSSDAAINDPEPEGAAAADPAKGIEIKYLTFSYPGSKEPALHNLSLEIPPGRTTALVGRIGCGKSTVFALLGRLYDPPPGTVFVLGNDIGNYSQAQLRSLVVQVPQEAFLFSTSVRSNLSLGLEDVSEGALWKALEAAHLKEEVEELSNGLDTSLGEKGLSLSGGQRQRMALARAFLHDAPVLLLDDPLSAVDTDTERAILDNLTRLRRGKTTLLVSHRLASVSFADRIYLLDKGRLAESGDHKSLSSAGGIYQSLFEEQDLLGKLED